MLEIPANFPKEPYPGLTVVRDAAYGGHAKQKLDLFAPVKTLKDAPVLVFVHGGGFGGGDKKDPGSPLYDNVMLWATGNGMIGVNINYRLSPEVSYPAQEQDLAAAIRWVRSNVRSHGGSPDRIVLWGHSSGAAVVANYVARKELQGPEHAAVKGAVLLSGPMDITQPPAFPYYGDPSLAAERSPLGALKTSSLPLLIGAGDNDMPVAIEQSKLANQELCAAGRCPTYVTATGNHLSEMLAVGTSATPLDDAVRNFVSKVARSR